MTLLDDMKALQSTVDDFKSASAALSCGSSCCSHSRDRGGQLVNGPCRCYPHDHPMRRFVYTATRLRTAAVNLLPKQEAPKPTRLKAVK